MLATVRNLGIFLLIGIRRYVDSKQGNIQSLILYEAKSVGRNKLENTAVDQAKDDNWDRIKL